MRLIFQKKKPTSEQGASFTWAAAPTDKKLTNGEILIISKVLKHVMSSAAEAEIGAVFYKCQGRSIPSYNIGRIRAPTTPTPMDTDNTTATGYSNGTIKQKRTKAMDMRFYWIKYRVKQGQFNVYWGPGYQNLADYFTKHITEECAKYIFTPTNNR
jgi:hypothetical protein